MAKGAGLTLDRLFYQTLLRKPNEFLTEGQRKITYKELFEDSVRLANGLSSCDLSGKRIAVLDWNSIEYAIALYGIPFAGSSIHPINVRLPLEQISRTIKTARDEALIVSKDFLPIAEKLAEAGLLSKKKIFTINVSSDDFSRFEDLIDDGEEVFTPKFDEDTEMSILFTSGTTGMPKAVSYTHRKTVTAIWAILTSLSAYQGLARLNSGDTVFPLIPFYHIWSWGSLFISTMIGTKYILGGKFDPISTLKLIKSEKATWMNMVPTMLYALLANDNESVLSGMKILIGGSPIPNGLVEEARKRKIELTSIYGFTDGLIASIGTINEAYGKIEDERKYEISTKYSTPSPLAELKIVKADGAPPEIFFRSPWLPDGYVSDETETKNAYVEGWFRPGDSGHIDEMGNLCIDDRVKDLIKSGGEFIPSSTLESYISGVPGVEMVAVVPRKDDKWVERPVAFVKSNKDFDNLVRNIKDLFDSLVKSGKISSWWIPDEFYRIDNMPLTGTGKIDKKELRKLLGGE
ncbi:medium-chain acyl-CoA ligase [Thermoplasma volcanium GSS1]|uniref:Medium-chain acyl-CoA ligase n=1 Tax=Thermoplasma volcanium (strain ATCC 51530 / DSM 4299 / JCM 9571 / NBRC 15438 / GSS1) TaxID=273116 RepID=Q97AY9_THEVO|nr:AMP-binding protein [Thermoplasma volcanium]BAB59812.1 medium-chain acyl-CoA ligase [Thermoplasma volcanium GSS1]